MDFNACAVEMDLTTSRPREPQPPGADGCKARAAKSVFSIRSLVDLADNGEPVENINGDADSESHYLLFQRLAMNIAGR